MEKDHYQSRSAYPSEAAFQSFRVAGSKQISHCVESAISLLTNGDERPLCLHTLPASLEVAELEKLIQRSKQNPSNNGIGKLISVVEIIKRKFGRGEVQLERVGPQEGRPVPDSGTLIEISEQPHEKAAALAGNQPVHKPVDGNSQSSKSSKINLHQYNECGCLEDLISAVISDDLVDHEQRVARILEQHDQIVDELLHTKRKRPKRLHTPYMKVYLSLVRVPSLDDSPTITYQPPASSGDAEQDVEGNALHNP